MIIQLLSNFCARKNQTFLDGNEEVTQKQCTKVCKNVTHTISIFTSEYMMNQNILWQDLLFSNPFSWAFLTTFSSKAKKNYCTGKSLITFQILSLSIRQQFFATPEGFL